MASTLDVCSHASNVMLNAVGGFADLPWTETTSSLVDAVLDVAARIEELKRLHDDDQAALPANVFTGPWGRSV